MTVLKIEKAGDTGELDGGLSLLFTTSAWNFCGEFYFRLFTVCSTFLRIRPTPRKALTFQRCWNGFFKFTLSLITIKLFIVFIPLVRNRTVSYIEIIFKGLFALQSHLSFLREIARINRGKQFQLRKLCKNWLVLGWYNHYRQFFWMRSENVLKVYFGILYSCEYHQITPKQRSARNYETGVLIVLFLKILYLTGPYFLNLEHRRYKCTQ